MEDRRKNEEDCEAERDEEERSEWNQREREKGKRRERGECSQTLLMPSPIETALFP